MRVVQVILADFDQKDFEDLDWRWLQMLFENIAKIGAKEFTVIAPCYNEGSIISRWSKCSPGLSPE